MLKLYNAPHSTCSQKVRICLHEKGLPFEDIKLDLGTGQDQLKPEYL
jgi:glutathione S-transferase